MATSLAAVLANHIQRLCSPELGGRLVGTPGELLARDALTEALLAFGYRLAPGHAEPFRATVALVEREPKLVVGDVELEYLVDYCVNVQGAVRGGRADGAAIWIGAEPPGQRVADKIAVCDPPVETDPAAALTAYLRRHRAARDAGARALLQVSTEYRRGKVMMHRRERPGLPSLDVSRALVPLAFDTVNPSVGQIGLTVSIDVSLTEREVTSAGNVVVASGAGAPRVVLVAHYDHIGPAPGGRYFAGAADNASGVAVVLEAARELMQDPPPAGLLVVLPSAEEAHMAGSASYVERCGDGLGGDALVVNVDEVGGDRGQPLSLLATPAASERLARLDLPRDRPVATHRLDCGGYADHVPFLTKVPAVVALTSASLPGVVHTLRDTPDRLSSLKLTAAVRLLAEIVRRALAH